MELHERIDQIALQVSDHNKANRLRYLHSKQLLEYRGYNISKMRQSQLRYAICEVKNNSESQLLKDTWIELLKFELKKMNAET